MCLFANCFLFTIAQCRKKHQISEWEAVIKTCNANGAGTDADVYIKLYYLTEHDQQTFYLDGPGDDFERGAVDRFGLSLMHDDVINLGLYYWPKGSLNEPWCVDWVILRNERLHNCFVSLFDKWIGYYKDPPTYPKSFVKSDWSKCARV